MFVYLLHFTSSVFPHISFGLASSQSVNQVIERDEGRQKVVFK